MQLSLHKIFQRSDRSYSRKILAHKSGVGIITLFCVLKITLQWLEDERICIIYAQCCSLVNP